MEDLIEKMEDLILNNFQQWHVAIGVFVSILLYYNINVSYIIKKILRIKISKNIKILDCFHCFSFWITLGMTLSPLTACIVYICTFLIDLIDSK